MWEKRQGTIQEPYFLMLHIFNVLFYTRKSDSINSQPEESLIFLECDVLYCKAHKIAKNALETKTEFTTYSNNSAFENMSVVEY